MKKLVLAVYGLLVLFFVSGCGITKGNGNADADNTKNTGYNSTNNQEKMYVKQNADYIEYEDAKELTGSANLVFSGTVYDKRCELLDDRTEKAGTIPDDGKGLYTIYGIYVDKVYKGSVDEDMVYVSVTGGELEKDNYIYSGDTVNLDMDRQYLFLASDYGEGYPSLVNISQSVYNMEDTGNKERVTAVGNPDGITLSEILGILNK